MFWLATKKIIFSPNVSAGDRKNFLVVATKTFFPNDYSGDHQSSMFLVATASDQRPAISYVRWVKKKLLIFEATFGIG